LDRNFLYRAILLSVILTFSACGGNPQSASTPAPTPVPTSPPALSVGKPAYLFVDNFSQGHLNSERQASTPTGRGALILGIPFGPHPIQTLTVIATYRYSFDVPIRAGEVLAFDVAKPYSIGPPVRAFVDVESSGYSGRIFQANVPPANTAGPVWHSYIIPLSGIKAHTARMTFGADWITDQTAAWVSFANLALYQR